MSSASGKHIGLIVYIALLPLMVVKDLPIVGSKIQLSDLAFLFLFVAVCRELLQRTLRPIWTPMGYGLILFLGVSALSAAFSVNRGVSLVELMAYGYMALLYLTIVNTVRTWSQWVQVLEIWIMVSTGVAFLGVLGFILALVGIPTPFVTQWPHLFIIKQPFWAVSSTFFASPTPAMVYEYLHIGTFLALGFLCHPTRQTRRLWYGAALVIHLLAILFSYTRGWVALLVSLFIFLWQFRSRVVVALRYVVFTVFLLVAVTNEFLALYNVVQVSVVTRESPGLQSEEQHRYIPYLRPDTPLKQLHAEITYVPFSRAFLRRIAMTMFTERPWLGIGPGSFSYEIHRRRSEVEARWGGFQVPGPWDPHSTYLGALAEIGVLGCGTLILIFGMTVWQCLRTLTARGVTPYRSLLWAVLSSVIGYLAFGWYDDLLTKRWFWFTMGLGGAGFALSKHPRRDTPSAELGSAPRHDTP